MIKILDHTKTLDLLVDDATNGLGQFEANSCTITEELNGIYEAEIEMLATDKHFNELSVGGLLQLEVNEAKDKQIFRIYYISKPINQVVQIKAQHITYDLNKIPVKPFTATGAVNAKNGMINNIIGTYPFTMTTDITNTTSVFTLDIPRSFRECLGGYEGSLLDTFRGEYEWDNLTVKMLAHRGSDNNVRISYGKNLTDFTQEENIENVYTSVLGYAVVNEQTYTGNVYHKIQSAYPKVKIVDFSSDYETTTPTTADLTQKAQSYAENNDIEIPNVNLSISFVPLYQTEEYKNIAPLERVSLGDTVHVYFDKLGVEASARVIKTVWNGNLGRYDSIELGNAKANLNTVLNEVQNQSTQEVNDAQGFLEAQMNQMASVIINGLGLHWTMEKVGTGYRIYLHNKETLAESDTQYIFTSAGFLVSTDYGQTWNAGFDSDGNVIVNSLSTILLRALEIYGSSITFGDENGKYINASVYSSGGTQQGVSFDGTGTIRLRPQKQFLVQNRAVNDGTTYNSMNLTSNGTVNTSVYTNNYVGTNSSANNLTMTSSATTNMARLNNYKFNSSLYANYVQLSTGSNQLSANLYNNQLSYDKTANRIFGESSASANRAGIYNLKVGADYVNNSIELANDSSKNTTNIINRSLAGTTIANELLMNSNGTYNSINLTNYDNLGVSLNYLRMNDNNDGICTLYSRSDLYLNSGGAVRINSSNSQDITMTSHDDIVIQASDKLYISISGTQHEIYFDSSGYLRWR